MIMAETCKNIAAGQIVIVKGLSLSDADRGGCKGKIKQFSAKLPKIVRYSKNHTVPQRKKHVLTTK